MKLIFIIYSYKAARKKLVSKLCKIISNISSSQPALENANSLLQKLDRVECFRDGKFNTIRANHVTRITELLLNGNLNVISTSLCLGHAVASTVLSELYGFIIEYL